MPDKKPDRNQPAKRPAPEQLKKAPKVYTADKIPVIAVDPETNAFLLDDGGLVDVLKITTKDYQYLSEQDKEFDDLLYDRLFRTYPEDLKIVSLYFPVDTSNQISHFRKMRDRTENPLFRNLLNNEIDLFYWIRQERREKEYFLFYFVADRTKHRERQTHIISTLSKGAVPLVRYMDVANKTAVLKLLNNKTGRSA